MILYYRCDQGGDCECLCTAISNFAENCNSIHIPFNNPLVWCKNREYSLIGTKLSWLVHWIDFSLTLQAESVFLPQIIQEPEHENS